MCDIMSNLDKLATTALTGSDHTLEAGQVDEDLSEWNDTTNPPTNEHVEQVTNNPNWVWLQVDWPNRTCIPGRDILVIWCIWFYCRLPD